MKKLLYELKNNYNAAGLKAEFESEGASYEEVEELKQLSLQSGLPLTLKIGGCGALRDMINAKKIGVNAIVAPMIESKYALNKFIQTYRTVYKEFNIDLYINIETETGYKTGRFVSWLTAVEWDRVEVCGRIKVNEEVGFCRFLQVPGRLSPGTCKISAVVYVVCRWQSFP